MLLEFEVPIQTVSEANRRDHWATRAKRARRQRMSAWQCTIYAAHRWGVVLDICRAVRATVTLTRFSSRRLDDDNMRAAMKAVRDGIADALHVDDGSDDVIWRYAQGAGKRRGTYVTIEYAATAHARVRNG